MTITLVWNDDDNDDAEATFIRGKDCCEEHPSENSWTLLSTRAIEDEMFDEVFEYLMTNKVEDAEVLELYLDQKYKARRSAADTESP